MSKLNKADKEKLFNITTGLHLTTNWEHNRALIAALYSENAPELEIATYWTQTSDFVYLTPGAEAIFGNYLQSIKRGDVLQSEHLEPISDLPGCYSMSLKLGGQMLGMLLVQVNDMALPVAEQLLQALIPQFSLARFASEMQEEVEKRTSTDKLTGLWKRSYFNERFREESERLSRSKEVGSVAIMGLDDMAAMVRMMPQDEQNELLEQAGKALRSLLRQTDWVVRWDNFEILFYFPNTAPEAAVEVFSRCVKALSRINPLLQVMIGLCSSAETTSARGLIQMADKRLNLARKDGRRQLVCFASKTTGLQFWEYKV
ncbi:MAG: GGDEF domain-containing protein [Candidatus Sericytochromatia bacterium]|nr:GGDEF domain-containing protein [Candidatus Sericytochromatia bacterium]